MSYYDHLHDVPDTITQCTHCSKKYTQFTEDQVPGFRSREFDFCPYCKESNGSSMEVEFYNKKID